MHSYEIPDGAVIGPFILRREETRRQLAVLSVVVKALAAMIFPRTCLVGACTVFLVCFHDTFHGRSSSPHGLNRSIQGSTRKTKKGITAPQPRRAGSALLRYQ